MGGAIAQLKNYMLGSTWYLYRLSIDVYDYYIIYNAHVQNLHTYTGESIELLDIGLRKAGGVPIVHRVKPSSPTHRLSVGSPRRHNLIK